MKRKLLIACLVLAALILAVYIFRYPLLRAASSFLIQQDNPQKADAVFVLSGNSYDRGKTAAKLYRSGYAPLIICTGANPVKDLLALNIDTLESEMTAAQLLHEAVPFTAIKVFSYGTSTREEGDTIAAYCRQQHFTKIIVVTSMLHTRRVNGVLRKKLQAGGMQLILYGAPSSNFKESEWWKSESGLIAVNNEWIKTFYYWWKY